MKITYNFKMKFDDSLTMSVFNISKRERTKANQCFKIIYGEKKYKNLQRLIKEQKGIMGIFNVMPTNELIIYALIMTQIQNQRKS